MDCLEIIVFIPGGGGGGHILFAREQRAPAVISVREGAAVQRVKGVGGGGARGDG